MGCSGRGERGSWGAPGVGVLLASKVTDPGPCVRAGGSHVGAKGVLGPQEGPGLRSRQRKGQEHVPGQGCKTGPLRRQEERSQVALRSLCRVETRGEGGVAGPGRFQSSPWVGMGVGERVRDFQGSLFLTARRPEGPGGLTRHRGGARRDCASRGCPEQSRRGLCPVVPGGPLLGSRSDAVTRTAPPGLVCVGWAFADLRG